MALEKMLLDEKDSVTWAMMLLGFAGLGFVAYRRQRRHGFRPRMVRTNPGLIGARARPMTLGNMRDRQICMSALIYIKLTRCVMSKMDNKSFDITDPGYPIL